MVQDLFDLCSGREGRFPKQWISVCRQLNLTPGLHHLWCVLRHPADMLAPILMDLNSGQNNALPDPDGQLTLLFICMGANLTADTQPALKSP